MTQNTTTPDARSPVPHGEVIEQLFLDIPIREALTARPGYEPLEPWISMYANSIREKRFGDAVWARYHMFGGVKDGIVTGSGNTVLQEIKEDALGYRVGFDDSMEWWDRAMAFYADASSEDGRPDVVYMIMNLDERDIAVTRARVEAEREEEEE